MEPCFFGASGFWRRALTSLLRDADRSAAYTSGGGASVRRARNAVVRFISIEYYV